MRAVSDNKGSSISRVIDFRDSVGRRKSSFSFLKILFVLLICTVPYWWKLFREREKGGKFVFFQDRQESNGGSAYFRKPLPERCYRSGSGMHCHQRLHMADPAHKKSGEQDKKTEKKCNHERRTGSAKRKFHRALKKKGFFTILLENAGLYAKLSGRS